MCKLLYSRSNVDLPFSWKLFRPLTELHSSGKEDPIISDLVPSANPQFSVFPSSGTLPALSNHIFLCQFLPHKVYNFNSLCTVNKVHKMSCEWWV